MHRIILKYFSIRYTQSFSYNYDCNCCYKTFISMYRILLLNNGIRDKILQKYVEILFIILEGGSIY